MAIGSAFGSTGIASKAQSIWWGRKKRSDRDPVEGGGRERFPCELHVTIFRPIRGFRRTPRLWAALQEASGGAWGGCIYDADAIIEALRRKK